MNIKKLFIFIMCVMLCVSASSLYAGEFAPGDVLVVLKPGSSQVSVSSLSSIGSDSLKLASVASQSGAYVVSSYKKLSEKSNNIFALIHSDTKEPDELAKELLSNPDVIAASPNYIARISAKTPNDTLYSELWGMKYINAPNAWDTATGSDNIYVAVIDTGVDWTNPDLQPNVDTNLAKTFVGNTSSALDDNGHGTHVAGIIGARGNNSIGVTGVNWNVKIIPIKTMNADGSGTLSDIMDGIEYVIDLVNQGYNVAALNMSLEFYSEGAPTYKNLTELPMWQACKELDNLNSTVIVVAAGNYQAVVGEPTTKTMYDGSGSTIYKPGMYVYPASFRGLNNFMSVSALDTDGSLADFTNTNGTMSAPGVEIYSTYLQASTNHIGSDGVSVLTMAGTSMAAPHAAGAIALLAAAKPSQTAFQYMCALLGVTDDSASISGKKLDIASSIEYQKNNAINTKGTKWDSEFGGGSNDTDNNNNSDSTTTAPEQTNMNVNNTEVVDTLLESLNLQSDYSNYVTKLDPDDSIISTQSRTAEDVAGEIPSDEELKLVFPLINPTATRVYVFKVNYSQLASGLSAGDDIYVQMTDTDASAQSVNISASTVIARLVNDYGEEITTLPANDSEGINIAGLMSSYGSYSTIITTSKTSSQQHSYSGSNSSSGGCNGLGMTLAGCFVICSLLIRKKF